MERKYRYRYKYDLTGKVFGRLTVVSYKGNRKNHSSWECNCECGKVILVPGGNLRNGSIISCGCYHRDRTIERNTTHGMSKSPAYACWKAMKYRCVNPKESDYKHYGGRGISVCDRWIDSFENFLEDMGERPEGTSIDRINNDGNYEPGNCRWATNIEQRNNTRRNRYISYNGEEKTLAEWGREVGIKSSIIYKRIFKRGWSVEKALTTRPRQTSLSK